MRRAADVQRFVAGRGLVAADDGAERHRSAAGRDPDADARGQVAVAQRQAAEVHDGEFGQGRQLLVRADELQHAGVGLAAVAVLQFVLRAAGAAEVLEQAELGLEQRAVLPVIAAERGEARIRRAGNALARNGREVQHEGLFVLGAEEGLPGRELALALRLDRGRCRQPVEQHEGIGPGRRVHVRLPVLRQRAVAHLRYGHGRREAVDDRDHVLIALPGDDVLGLVTDVEIDIEQRLALHALGRGHEHEGLGAEDGAVEQLAVGADDDLARRDAHEDVGAAFELRVRHLRRRRIAQHGDGRLQLRTRGPVVQQLAQFGGVGEACDQHQDGGTEQLGGVQTAGHGVSVSLRSGMAGGVPAHRP